MPYRLLFCLGEVRVSSALAGIFDATTPIFMVLIAPIFLSSERPTIRRIIGLSFSFLGVMIVFGFWNSGSQGDLLGSLECLGAALCYGIGSPYTRKYITNKVTILEQSAMQLIAATVLSRDGKAEQ